MISQFSTGKIQIPHHCLQCFADLPSCLLFQPLLPASGCHCDNFSVIQMYQSPGDLKVSFFQPEITLPSSSNAESVLQVSAPSPPLRQASSSFPSYGWHPELLTFISPCLFPSRPHTYPNLYLCFCVFVCFFMFPPTECKFHQGPTWLCHC